MNSSGKNIAGISAGTILFFFICLFAYIKLVGPIPFSITSVSTTKDTLFTVSGKGEVTAIPDTATLSLGVTKKANTVQAAQDEVNTIINKLTQDLQTLGVQAKNIKTTNYSVNPEYDYSAGNQKLTGYSVDTNLEVQITPIDKANQAVDISTRDGATNVGGIQFVVADDKQKQLENQARQQAIDDAKSKAALLSNEAGIKLGRIIDVQETPQYSPMPYVANSLMAKTADGISSPPTELNPGQNKITTTVTLSYETF
jgi:uncharacterized protein YggE